MSVRKEIETLKKAGVISNQIAVDIIQYYQQDSKKSGNSLMTVLAIFGGSLVGLGIILILAHNWDNLSRMVRTIIAFVPLVVAQSLSVYTLLKKQDSQPWREGISTFLFFSVGACMSLVSQIYNIPGDVTTFLAVWLLLCLPIVYIMKSSIVSMLYIVGVTYYGCETIYWSSYQVAKLHWFWIGFIGILPYYYHLIKSNSVGYFTRLHHWVLAIVLIVLLATIAKQNDSVMFVGYTSLFGFFFLLGGTVLFDKTRAYKFVGSLGTIIMALIMSYNDVWEHLTTFYRGQILSQEFIVSYGITLLALAIFLYQIKIKGIRGVEPIQIFFLVFATMFMFEELKPIGALMVNLFLIGAGGYQIVKGIRQDDLRVLNYGILIILVLILCRFFDDSLTFVLKGTLFMLTGVGCIVLNYRLLKKRQTDEA